MIDIERRHDFRIVLIILCLFLSCFRFVGLIWRLRKLMKMIEMCWVKMTTKVIDDWSLMLMSVKKNEIWDWIDWHEKKTMMRRRRRWDLREDDDERDQWSMIDCDPWREWDFEILRWLWRLRFVLLMWLTIEKSPNFEKKTKLSKNIGRRNIFYWRMYWRRWWDFLIENAAWAILDNGWGCVPSEFVVVFEPWGAVSLWCARYFFVRGPGGRSSCDWLIAGELFPSFSIVSWWVRVDSGGTYWVILSLIVWRLVSLSSWTLVSWRDWGVRHYRHTTTLLSWWGRG